MDMFWRRVADLRESLSMNIGELWDAIGKSRRTCDDWIRYNRIPSGDICVEIAKVLGTTVEYLITGYETPLEDDDDKPPEEFHLPNGKTITPSAEEPSVLVPIVRQRLSAGNGLTYMGPSNSVGSVRVLERMARGLDPARLIAAQVTGDSMTGVQIFEGDLVIFATGHVSANGICVIALANEVMVKRLEFNPLTKEVSIISENPRYQTITTRADNDEFRILGKVVGWIHVHPY